MKILFVNLSGLKFSVLTPDNEPLGGTESCVCHLAKALAARGHDVTLMAHLPADTNAGARLAQVRHLPASVIRDAVFFAHEHFDAIIAVNAPTAVPLLRGHSPGSFIVLWDHVPPEQPAMKEYGLSVVQHSLDAVVYVSDWQKRVTEAFFRAALPQPEAKPKPHVVIGNGLTPAFENMFGDAAEILAVKQLRMAYTTIPYRGLPILLAASESVPDAPGIDIFSSMRLYQADDEAYSDLQKRALSHVQNRWHGVVAQPELARHLRTIAFLTYPCIVAETFCLAALEALAAGMEVLTTDLGALPATLRGHGRLLPIHSTDGTVLVTDFGRLMQQAIVDFDRDPRAWAEARWAQVQDINLSFRWRDRALNWEAFLEKRGA